jgi:valyl-tRNA synthetase
MEETMTFEKQFQADQRENEMMTRWQDAGTYAFHLEDPGPVFSIDTPPATVSGHLHLGHVYSYSHADFIARYQRMRGRSVFYPMGFDDNGLPTERLVEKRQKISAAQVGRKAFIERCLETSIEAEQEYRDLWQRLGLSIDWRYTYRTIDAPARRCSQQSFIDLYQKGFVYRSKAPAIWCPECHTALAQADLEDRERTTEFVTLPFRFADEADTPSGAALHIATTRPELLAACVAVFVNPNDPRYQAALGKTVRVPLYGQPVAVLADAAADPEKGTGAVMCCTFGDQTDVAWWYTYHLPLIEAIDAHGRMLPAADLPGLALAGQTAEAARAQIKAALEAQGLILGRQPTSGAVRVHERCDTPVEYRLTRQWFIRILDHKEKFLELGRQIHWHPEHMHARYQAWVENLNWDWCISRQRDYGVPFPVWTCKQCGAVLLADPADLPVDPTLQGPGRACACGGTDFEPETDIMDTWATSSVSPQIASGWLSEPQRFEKLFPMTLRPQAHEIIRTWAFYTIVKSWYQFEQLPWSDVFISGWGLAGAGMGKISKSKGGGPMAPMEMIRRYSADALRYWAASTAPGKDALISEEKIQMGQKLATKLWNVARFAEPFLREDFSGQPESGLTPADAWILARLEALVRRSTACFEDYDYANAKTEIESFFWRDLADNYLEMAKQRLYDASHPGHSAACRTLKTALETLLKLLAPLLPYITEAIWCELFAADAGQHGTASIHRSAWPVVETAADLNANQALAVGETLVEIATAVRRYKSENALSLGSELAGLTLATGDPALADQLQAAIPDLVSVTRAKTIHVALQPQEAESQGSDLAERTTPLLLEHSALRAAVLRTGQMKED